MSVITTLATPEMLSTLITVRTFATIGAFVGAIILAMGMTSIMTMRGGGDTSWMLLAGRAILVSAFIVVAAASYGIVYVNDNRPFNITPAFGYNESKFQQIASLKDNSMTNGISGHGAFFLGCGGMSISGGNTIPVYVFYKRMPNEEYIQDSLPSANVYIKEDGNDDPRIEWIYYHAVSEKKVYADDGETIGGIDLSTLTKTIMHVPKGTVKIDYNLDSEVSG